MVGDWVPYLYAAFVEVGNHFLHMLVLTPHAACACLNDPVPGRKPPRGGGAWDTDNTEPAIRCSSVHPQRPECHPPGAVVILCRRRRAAYSSDDRPC